MERERLSNNDDVTRGSLPCLRWRVYFRERFPLLAYSVLIASFYSANQLLAQALSNPNAVLGWNLGALFGCFTLLCVFLHLRIFDDHKDYADDCRFYPYRALQRGVVTLGELKVLGGGAIVIELLLGVLGGMGSFVSVLFVISFSLLMLKEFFAKNWLKRHLLIYAATHMLIMPLLAILVFSFATQEYPWQTPGWYWTYALVGTLLAFSGEISRKTRAPAEEIEGVASYTKILGTYGAVHAVWLVRIIATALVAVLGYHLQVSIWFYVVLAMLFIAALIASLPFYWQASQSAARRMESYAGIYIVVFNITLAVELACTYGVRFTGLK